jgi:hypothetical protein
VENAIAKAVEQLQRVGQRLPEGSMDFVVMCSANCLAGGGIRMFTSPGMSVRFPPLSQLLQKETALSPAVSALIVF